MPNDDVKLQLLHAAGAVFAERGYKAATVRDICATAGVNLAAVNYYFGDKAQLYLETVKLAHQLKTQRIPMPEWSGEISPQEKLHEFVRILLTRMLGEQELWQTQLMMREVICPTDACRALVEDYFRPQFEILLKILHELVPKATPVPRVRQLAFSIIGQCFFYLAAGTTIPMMISQKEMRSHYSIDQLADHIANFSYAAICGHSKTNSREHWLSPSTASSRNKGKLKAK